MVLPDICGKIEYPNSNTSKRYVDWFDKYVLEKYTHEVGPSHTKTVFLSGRDCYAFRCSLLHQGSDDITDQEKRETLTKFEFTYPVRGTTVHSNKKNSTLQLQVDIFCNDIIEAVEQWINDINGDVIKEKKLGELLKIGSHPTSF